MCDTCANLFIFVFFQFTLIYLRKRINRPLHGSTKQHYNHQLNIINDDEWYVHVSSKISDDENYLADSVLPYKVESIFTSFYY